MLSFFNKYFWYEEVTAKQVCFHLKFAWFCLFTLNFDSLKVSIFSFSFTSWSLGYLPLKLQLQSLSVLIVLCFFKTLSASLRLKSFLEVLGVGSILLHGAESTEIFNLEVSRFLPVFQLKLQEIQPQWGNIFL